MVIPNEVYPFLLNVALIIILYFVYASFLHGEIPLKYSDQTMIAIISSVSIISCMAFPLKVIPGMNLDMRVIPFMIGSFYGGRKVALFLLALMLSFRLYINDGTDFYHLCMICISYLFVFFFMFYLIPKFLKERSTKKRIQYILYICFIGKVTFLTTVFAKGVPFHLYIVSGLIGFSIIQIILVLIFVMMLEKGKQEKKLRAKLQKMEKLSVVSDMAASISHEVRNPLTVTKGFLQLLKEPDIPHDKQLLYIDLSIGELERAEGIISDYLTFAKPDLNQSECLNIYEELQSFLNIITPYAKMYNVDIAVNVEDTKLFMYGDREKLQQCFLNVAKNGIEAMQKGGKLLINLEKEENRVLISFTDTGNGMNEDQLNRLGTPFYSTKEKGTGLGTMVVYSLAEVMGGEVYVMSQVNVGTTFQFIFPIVEKSEEKIAN